MFNFIIFTMHVFYFVFHTHFKISTNKNLFLVFLGNFLLQIDIPLRPSRKARSLVWKNWSRMQIFNLFKETPSDTSTKSESSTCSDAAIKKRAKHSLTLTNFNFSRHYRSMRNKARKICRKSHSTSALNADQISATDPH